MRTIRKFLYCPAVGVVAAGCISTVYSFQSPKWKPAHEGITMEQLRPEKGEASIDKIIESCNKFLSDVGLVPPKGSIPGIKRSSISKKRSGIYSVFYGSMFDFSVRADTGKVNLFYYSGREFEYSHGKKQKPPYLLTDPINAKGYLNRIRKKLGLGDNMQIVKFECNLNGDKRNWELGKVGFVRMRLEAFEHGYSAGRYCHAGITVDPQDGALISYGAPSDIPLKIESHVAKLSFDQAKAKATPAATKYQVGIYRIGYPGDFIGLKRGDKLPPSKRPSILRYVLPNGEFGGMKYSNDERPRRLRLAWVLMYPEDEQIWIDAGDGKVLGGVYHR